MTATTPPLPRASDQAAECAMCNDSGIVGFPPDQYEECPDCIKARAVIAHSAAQAPEGDTRQLRKATVELALPELAAEFRAVSELGCDYTISAGVCAKLADVLASPAAPTCTPADERAQDERDALADLRQAVRDSASDEWLLMFIRQRPLASRAAQGAGTAPVDTRVDACFTPLENEQYRVIKSLQAKLIAMQVNRNEWKKIAETQAELHLAATHPAPVSTAAAPTCKPAQAAPEPICSPNCFWGDCPPCVAAGLVAAPEAPATERPNLSKRNHVGAGLRLAEAIVREQIAATEAPATESGTMTVQEVWLAAGGNPGIAASKQDVLEALKMMDEAVDECDEHHRAPATEQQAATMASASGELTECAACDGQGCTHYPDGEWQGKCGACKGTGIDSRAADGQQGASRAALDLSGLTLHYKEGVENGGYYLATDVIRLNTLARAQLPAQAGGQAVDDARDAWQPIETAPADCLLLLAYEFDRPADWRIKVGGYWNDEWEVFGASWTPTRWRPLPPVPNVSDYEARRAAQSRTQSDITGDKKA